MGTATRSPRPRCANDEPTRNGLPGGMGKRTRLPVRFVIQHGQRSTVAHATQTGRLSPRGVLPRPRPPNPLFGLPPACPPPPAAQPPPPPTPHPAPPPAAPAKPPPAEGAAPPVAV